MITNDLQKRIQHGDREAFRSVYTKYGRDVYLTALHALGSEEAARGVVKQTFLVLHNELMRASDDVDLAVRIRELSENELLLLEILKTGGGEQAASAVAERAKSAARARIYVEPETEPEDEAESAIPEDLPPLERTRAYMRADHAPGAAPKREKKSGSSRFGHAISVFLLFVFLLLLLCTLAGVLMGLGFIPKFDLGYGWFNNSVFPLFHLGA